jgi:hypothetical protein
MLRQQRLTRLWRLASKMIALNRLGVVFSVLEIDCKMRSNSFLGLKLMNWHQIVPHAVVAAGSIFFASAPFLPRYRAISRWMRAVFFSLALSGIAWSGIEFWLLSHSTQLTRQARWTLFQGQAILAGIFLGLLISLFFSPEFWRLRRRPTRLSAWLESLIKT